MYKLVVVLFTVNSVVVCSSFETKDYLVPAATITIAPKDARQYEFGVSKKYGYNKMVVATYLGPVKEEASESYTNYIIHPVDTERGQSQKEKSAKQVENPVVNEDTSETKSFLKMLPIVVEDSEETEEENPKTQYRGYRQKDDLGNGDSYRTWFSIEEPKAKNVLDEEIQDMYLAWFEKEEPKTVVVEGYWKNFKNDLDTLYEERFKQFFGDDNDSDRFTKESESDKKNDDFDWFPDIPYKYEYEDKKDDDRDKKNNKWDYFTQEPKYDFKRNYDFNDNDYGYRWWREW